MSIQKSVLFAVLMIGIATPGNGQSNKKFEVFGSVGAVYYSGSGANMDYGGGFGFRPYGTKSNWMRGWELEFNLSVTNLTEQTSYKPTQTHYTANVLYHFLSRRVQPYVLIGAGGSYEPGDSDPPPHGAPYISVNRFLANAGGGLRIAFNDRWSIRPEYRGFDVSHGDNFDRFAVFLGYHF